MHSRNVPRVFVSLLMLWTLMAGVIIASPPQAAHASAAPIYVDAGASGANDGSSWANAYTDLQSALTGATSGDQIWVAEGSYKPGASGSRTATFQLKNGVAMYGGFAGTESSLGERDWRTHVTTLSGDLNGNGRDDNDAYHVVTVGSSLTSTARLDGFTITGGNANDPSVFGGPNTMGGGLYDDAGGSVTGGNPVLENLVITGNQANMGAGAFFYTQTSMTLTDVVFKGNYANAQLGTGWAGASGGALEAWFGNLTFVNAVFSGNNAGSNYSSSRGGAIHAQYSTMTFINSTFIGNATSSYGGGAIYGYGVGGAPFSATFVNSILWDNSPNHLSGGGGAATFSVSYSDVQGSGGSAAWSLTGVTDGGANIDSDPNFVSPVAPASSPTAAGDLHLVSPSPAINAGSNAAVPVSVTTDLDGYPRIAKTTVDMGPYEYQGIIYVDIDAVGANNGSSWANAYTDLQPALTAATSGDQIWVAEGSYKPGASGSRTATFQLKNGVAVYGGFAGTESSLGERDWRAHVTTLSGDLNGNGRDDNDAYHVVTVGSSVTSSARLDGFTITGGNANDPSVFGGPNTMGGGLNDDADGSATGGNPVLENLVITGNQANIGAGAFFYTQTSMTLTNVVFKGNYANAQLGLGWATADGGAFTAWSGNLTFVNAVFSGNNAGSNYSSSRGGAIHAQYSTMTFINSTFIGNATSSYGGGAIYGYGVGGAAFSATFVNSILWDNSPNHLSGGGGAATFTVSYSDVQGSGGSAAWSLAGVTDGGNNIDSNPNFVSPVSSASAPTTAGDLHLLSPSPAINAGSNAAVPVSVTTDLDGYPRIAKTIVDQGPYEYQADSAPVVVGQPADKTVTETQTASFSAAAGGAYPAPAVQWQLSTNSGTTWDNILGANSTTYTTEATTLGMSGNQYRAVFGNGVLPDATSNAATLTVNPGTAPVITSADSATFVSGAAGSFTVTATGIPVPTITVSGTLPSGVTYDSGTATLSGTPGAGTAGVYSLTFTAANGVLPDATQPFTLSVNAAPAITSAATTTFTVGAAGSFIVTASGYPIPTITSSGTLPTGVTFDSGTATLSGTPGSGTGGSYSLTFTAANGVLPDATQSFTLVVDEAPSITSVSSSTFNVGIAGSFTVTATGYPAPTITSSGTLPTGVTFDSATATLSGTPAIGTAGSYPLTFAAANGTLPDATQAFTLTIAAANVAPTITTDPIDQTTMAGQMVTFSAAASGYPAPTVHWEVLRVGGRWTNIKGATSLTYTLTAQTADSGKQYRAIFTNVAGTATTNAATLTVNGADVAIVKTGVYDPGTNTITWTLTVTNNGPGVAQGIEVTDNIVNGTKILSVTVDGAAGYSSKIRGRTLTVSIPTVDPGASATIITVEALVTKISGTVTDTATVTTDTSDPNLANNTDTASVTVP